MDLTLIEQGNLRNSETSIYVWHESHKEFGAKISVIISVTGNAVHCHRRGV